MSWKPKPNTKPRLALLLSHEAYASAKVEADRERMPLSQWIRKLVDAEVGYPINGVLEYVRYQRPRELTRWVQVRDMRALTYARLQRRCEGATERLGRKVYPSLYVEGLILRHVCEQINEGLRVRRAKAKARRALAR